MADGQEIEPQGSGIPASTRGSHTAGLRASVLLKALNEQWDAWFPDGEKDEFFRWFVRPLWDGAVGAFALDSSDPDDILFYSFSDLGHADFAELNASPSGDELRELIVATAYCVRAIKEDQAGNTNAAWDYAFDAAAHEGFLSGLVVASTKAQGAVAQVQQEPSAIEKKRKADAKRAAEILHSTGAKAVAKSFVKECWQDWRKGLRRWKSATKFANDMMQKQPILESEEVIRRWIREWDAEASQPPPGAASA